MEERIDNVVQKHGWFAANIPDHEPPFLYSIGLMRTWEHPELIVFGLEADDAHALCSVIVDRIREGESFAERGVYTIPIGDDKHTIGIRRVDSTRHSQFLGYAMAYQRYIGCPGSLEAVQVFWPDRRGKFPFDPGCELDVYEDQPRLDIGMTPREVREFDREWE